MERIAIFGKGGGGKSTIATNLSCLYAKQGLRVLHVGCDPKRDSTLRLLGRRAPMAMSDMTSQADPASAVLRSPVGAIDCIETGGPVPGVGCAGRGIILTMEQLERLQLLQDGRYDVVIFDILGDLVCGGFAAPLRHGFVQKIVVVLSDEPMSILAANNIARMVCAYGTSGVRLAGLVGNCRFNPESASRVLKRFAGLLGTKVLAHFGGESLVRRAERINQTVAQFSPDSALTQAFARLAKRLHDIDPVTLPPPTPLDEASLDQFLREADPLPESGDA